MEITMVLDETTIGETLDGLALMTLPVESAFPPLPPFLFFGDDDEDEDDIDDEDDFDDMDDFDDNSFEDEDFDDDDDDYGDEDDDYDYEEDVGYEDFDD
jgi:hypothetical protein